MQNPISDDDFMAKALREGHWERFEDPKKGDTLTLYVGNFPILSVHAALADRHLAIRRFTRSLQSAAVTAALIARVAQLERELAIAVEALAVNSRTSEVVIEE